MRDLLIVFVVALSLAVCGATFAYGMDPDEVPETVIDRSETNVSVRTSPTNELDALCGGSNAKVDVGSVGAAFPSLPCESVRTDLALERLEGRGGFMAGSTRFFLNARLFMRGVGSTLFGVFGLG